MARKLAKSGFVTIAELARKLGVSGQAVSQAIRSGRLIAFNNNGERVSAGYAGRKWLDPATAAEGWHNRRQRYDDPAASDDLVAARMRTARLQGALLSLRFARERGDTIPRSEALAAAESLGRSVQRALMGIVGWSEELAAAAQDGGLVAVSARLQALSAELEGSLADLIMAASEECGHEG